MIRNLRKSDIDQANLLLSKFNYQITEEFKRFSWDSRSSHGKLRRHGCSDRDGLRRKWWKSGRGNCRRIEGKACRCGWQGCQRLKNKEKEYV